MKICPGCGAQLKDTDVFCQSCGARVETPENPSQSAAQAVFQSEPPAAPGYVPPAREQAAPPVPVAEPPRQDGGPYYAPPYGQAMPNYAAEPQTKDWNRPLSTWAYALSLFLMGLPVAGFIIQIIWAVGGTNSVNRQNLARGYLFLRVCLIVLAVLLSVVFLALVAPLLRRILSEFGGYFNGFHFYY